MANPFEKDLNQDPFREHESNNIDSYLPPSILADDLVNTQSPTMYGGPALDGTPYNRAEINKEGKGLPEATPQLFFPTTAAAMATPNDTAQGTQEIKPTSKFWTIEFYQQFFDINTQQVLIRISNALVPINPPDFLMDRNWHYATGNESWMHNNPTEAIPQGELIIDGIQLSRKPDLYGPFWICTTLWMLLGVVSNIMGRISYIRHNQNASANWNYDFSVSIIACMVIYLYCFVFGTLVWGVMHWKNLPVTLTDTLCLYGYSMFIFILAALLCMIPISTLQWSVVMFSGLWSTAFLVSNFWFMWKNSLDQKSFLMIVALVVVFHMALSLSFKFYFMNYIY